MHDESYHTVNILRFWYWEINVWLLIEHIKRRVTLNLNKKCMRLTYGYFVHILLEVLEIFFSKSVSTIFIYLKLFCLPFHNLTSHADSKKLIYPVIVCPDLGRISKEIMHYLYVTNMATPQNKNPYPGGHEIYTFL